LDAVAVAWLEPSGEHAPSPEREASERAARRALDEWALARGLRLVTAESRPAPEVAVDMTIADRVEELLSRARDAMTTQDQEGAERALASAEGLLRSHPELPNAAWLMAEVHRGWSARWSRLSSGDPSRAAAEWKRAAAIDGGRTAGVGESSSSGDREVVASLALEGDGEAWLDGASVARGPLHVRPGEHQLVVTAGSSGHGPVVWSEWVTFAAGTTLRLAVPEAAACSTEDLSRARVASGVVVATGIHCPAWAAATVATAGTGLTLGGATVLVATCEGDHCGPLVSWSVGAPRGDDRRAEASHQHGWPAWATWTLVGVGVAAAAVGVTLGATGAFRSSPPGPTFVNGGLSVNVTPLRPF